MSSRGLDSIAEEVKIKLKQGRSTFLYPGIGLAEAMWWEINGILYTIFLSSGCLGQCGCIFYWKVVTPKTDETEVFIVSTGVDDNCQHHGAY